MLTVSNLLLLLNSKSIGFPVGVNVMEDLQAEGARRPEDSKSLRSGHTAFGKGALNFQRSKDWAVQGYWTWISKAGRVSTDFGVALYIQGIMILLSMQKQSLCSQGQVRDTSLARRFWLTPEDPN